jgi:hypothetical protein
VAVLQPGVLQIFHETCVDSKRHALYTFIASPLEEMLRSSGKTIAALVLSIAVLQASTFAEVAPALGQVIQAERAHLGASPAAGGSTLFDGDRLVTDAAGSLHARLGSGQLYLLAGSLAAIHRTPSGSSATLQGGTAIFAMANPESFELEALGVKFRAHPGGEPGIPTLGQLTVTGPKEFVVACHRGTLDVFIGNEVRTVAANTAVRVVLDPSEEAAAQAPPGTVHGAHRSTLFMWIIIGTVATVTTIFVIRALRRVTPN